MITSLFRKLTKVSTHNIKMDIDEMSDQLEPGRTAQSTIKKKKNIVNKR